MTFVLIVTMYIDGVFHVISYLTQNANNDKIFSVGECICIITEQGQKMKKLLSSFFFVVHREAETGNEETDTT